MQTTLLLFAGQGPLLRAYDHGTRQLLCSQRVFDTQAVHGITSHQFSEHSTETLLLIWGLRSVCVVQVRIGDDENSHDGFHMTIQDVVPETETEDRILDACFLSARVDDERSDGSVIEATLVTAHNVVLYLHALLDLTSYLAINTSICQLATGPRCILYSAHIIWKDSNTPGIVAAGTVSGEILHWSFRPDDATRSGCSRQPGTGVLHHKFEGHESSVFGVRLSEEAIDERSGLPNRILASCSDDRTIRLWDISSDLDGNPGNDSTKGLIEPAFGGNDGDIDHKSSPSIAIAMGHASRIWGLRFLCYANSHGYLLSFGEDATAQIWHPLSRPNAVDCQPSLSAKTSLVLQNHVKNKFHSGKNIWACAVYQGSVSSNLVCTGGADGRIVCFDVQNPNVFPYGDGFSSRSTFEEARCMSKACNPSELEEARIATPNLRSSIFIAMEGRWKIVRNLDSAAPTYPSGIFEGIAVFEKRPPTNPEYEAEYLYLEDGQLTTRQGLSLTATRRYVYRLQKGTHAISSWFVKPDDGSTVDYLFHELNFAETKDDQKKIGNIGRLVATGHHLCIDDDYRVEYGFQAREGTLTGWSLRYTVKGPKKDYIMDAEYARDDWPSESKAEMDPSQSIARDPSESILTQEKKSTWNLSKIDSFKAYTWINEDLFLATTDLGWLLAGTLRDTRDQSGFAGVYSSKSVSWERITKVDNLNGPSIATSICIHETAIFAASGTIYIYLHGDKSIHSPFKVPGKIAYMAAHLLSKKYRDPQSNTFEVGIVISCLGSSTTSLFFVEVDKEQSKCSVRRDIILGRSPSFIVTSSCLIDSRAALMLGSRNGSLAIYLFALSAISVLRTSQIDNIHGKDAITTIEKLPTTSSPEAEHDTMYILTAGRNGTYAIHHMYLDSPTSPYVSINFHTVHTATTPIGNIIEGSHFCPRTKHLLLWGFRSKYFIVWNESLKQEIMRSECGGAHRNWAFLPPLQEGKAGGNLVWTKASDCHVHTQRGGSHIVLQEGGHGREVKALAIFPGIIITTPRIRGSTRSKGRSSSSGRFTSQNSAKSTLQATKIYLATGAEDTEIRIFEITCSAFPSFPCARHTNSVFKCTNIISKHTTGLQALRWSQDSKYLFSAAGCDEFFVWRITPLPFGKEIGSQLGVVCEAIAPTSEQRDLRVMDFDVMENILYSSSNDKKEGEKEKGYTVSMVFSDSSVRVSKVSSFPPPA